MTTTLDSHPLGEPARVHAVQPPAEAPEWGRWLEEIGFIPGERVTLMARGMPGGDPLVVRVGQSTFALRRAEAACVQLRPLEAPAMQPRTAHDRSAAGEGLLAARPAAASEAGEAR